MRKKTPKLLEDIRDAAAYIRELAQGRTLDDYERDRMLRQAVERNFEIIGEAIEELVLVVEDETFVGRKLLFSYYFSGKCWVNNHTHVLHAWRDVVLPKYLNLALSYYPFTPLTTGSTGRRKLTKAALMSAPIKVPDLSTQHRIVVEADRRLTIVREVEAEVDANLKRAQALRQAVLARALGGNGSGLD
jgi:restriction endonuclease S subunit